MTTDQLRKRYLDFFKSKAHKVFGSDSLIPQNDPSLLFTGAGMNQFKPYFLGLKKDVKRAASCQKCLRTADLDRVGKTPSHHSFFEMLGNFSFGDYFKEEAILWGWEFVTKELSLPKSKLWISVYEEDEEAFQIWKKKIGLAESSIVRMGAVDNFWPSNAKLDGPNGPCGPCSEIYVGDTPGKGVEIWNLVFTQFDRQSNGTLLNLPQKNIDTGMGLERTAAVLQGVPSNFDVDIFKKIREELRNFTAAKNPDAAHENAVMDHLRAVVFCIADGALPSNEGRGYVVRKLIRLGSDHWLKAGALKAGELHKLVPVIISVMGTAYPEVLDRQKNILATIQNEENAYLEIRRVQQPRLEAEILQIREGLKAPGSKEMSKKTAELAFKYYDTYGVPLDFILSCAEKAGLALEEEIFNQSFDALLRLQKNRSRQSSKISSEIFSKDSSAVFVEGLTPTRFLGYEKMKTEARLLTILKDKKKAESLKAAEEGIFIFDETPFYAEAGGQVGDTGVISAAGFEAKVLDTQKFENCAAHKVRVEHGEAFCGKKYELCVDEGRRMRIMKNHTATHLLHSALRKVLGEHVKQSGSLVAPDRLRFDFTHFSALDAKTLYAIEALVNEEIKKAVLLEKKVLSKEKAMKEGAIAFFGEKYADEVRVVTIGNFSKELCGGTHLNSTREIGFFKIISESSIQSGVRRIEAVTGDSALEKVEEGKREITELAKAFHSTEDSLPQTLGQMGERVSGLRARLGQLTAGYVNKKIDESFAQARAVGGAKLVVEEIPRADVALLEKAAEHLRLSKEPFAAFLVSAFSDKISFVVAGGEALVKKGFHAGKIVKQIALILQGNGGGRPDFAVGGGRDVAKKAEALRQGERELENCLKTLAVGK